MHPLGRQRIEQRLAREQGHVQKHDPKWRIGLAYPNHYYFGMSNLGFQTLYRIFNEGSSVSCERLFLPEDDLLPQMAPGSLATYEHLTPVTGLDCVAFSISYQNDILNLIPMLHLLGLASLAEERQDSDPLIIAGGPALTINPEPAARLLDAIVIGEGEEVAGDILALIQSGMTKKEQLLALSRLPGVYVPSLYPNHYQQRAHATKANQGFGLVSGQPNGKVQDFEFIQRLVVKDPDLGLAQSQVLTEETEFGDLFLMEVQRGCQWGCRFCAAGFMYRYPRYQPQVQLQQRIDAALKQRPKLGLIAGDLLGYQGIGEILKYIDERGGAFSPSSVRLNAFTPEIIHYLKKSGNRTIAIAPEAGSERLRRSLNKTFTQEEITSAAVQLAEGGIHNIKLYIMIGLPTEDEDDIEELCELTVATRRALSTYAKKSGKMPQLTLSVSPFVPKPSTPLQYEGFAGIKTLKSTAQTIRKTLMPHGHIKMTGESVLDAYIETLLSRGDRQVSEFLQAAVQPFGRALKVGTPGHLKKALKSLSFDPDDWVTQTLDSHESTPWDFIDHGMKENYFARETKKFHTQKITHHCMPEVCRSCGVC